MRSEAAASPDSSAPASYRGRFAPSPTGPLHLGSLLAALGSYLDARAHNGRWLIRIEDIDPPRESPGASRAILDSLSAHGLESDEPVLFQSSRLREYETAVERLLAAGEAFYCSCSRQELSAAGGRHASHCTRTAEFPDRPVSVRYRCTGALLRHRDFLVGAPTPAAPEDSFVIKRKDGLYAYHLAVVVDDAFQRITHVVRGRDLLESTPLHITLQHALGLPTPHYGHLPLLLSTDGQKLSKQNLARALDDRTATDNLRLCLRALGQPDPPELRCDELLRWAATHWERARVPARDTVLTPV